MVYELYYFLLYNEGIEQAGKNTMKKTSILFVCMGNICRSPTAEGIFRHLVDNQNLTDFFSFDSAGTHAYHVGEPPDHRAQEAAQSRGIDLSDLKARKVTAADFDSFDYVLAMDKDNLSLLRELCPSASKDQLKLFLEFAKNLDFDEVPDPYYGGTKGFEKVFDMLENASHGLIEHIQGK